MESSAEFGRSAAAKWKDAYSRLFGRVGTLLLGRANSDRMRPSILTVMMALSLAAASGSAAIPFIFGSPGRPLVEFAFPLSAIWALIVIVAVFRCGARGLWTVVSLPLALTRLT